MSKINRSLAIIIGIDQYDHIRKLKNAANDAQAVAEVLDKRYGYKVLSLLDREAICENLSNLLKNLDHQTIQLPDGLIQVERSDRVLFYFAGHGFPEETEESVDVKPAGYLMAQDSRQDDKDTWLSMEKLHDALTRLNCLHLLMILDCCFAGRILWAGLKRNAGRSRKMYRQSYDRFIKFPAQQVVISAAHDQEAQDSFRFGQRGEENGHSPFADLLLNVLNAKPERVEKDLYLKAIIEDGVITVHELFTYLQNKLGAVAEWQTPGLFHLKKHDKGEYIFPLPNFKREQLEELKLDENTNPYKGLASFEPKDSQLFLGRKRLIEHLCEKVVKQELTVVLGFSGSGKSSLVKAGLIAVINSEAENKENSQEQWYVLNPMRPGELPLTAFARVILPIENLYLVDQLSQLKFLDDILTLKPKEVQQAKNSNQIELIQGQNLGWNDEEFNNLVRAWESANPEGKLLLILDYFEKLEKFCFDSEKQRLLSEIKDNIENSLNLLIKKLQSNSQDSPSYLIEIIKKWSQNNHNSKLLLVIDQGEELITLCRNDKEKQAFLQLLAGALVSRELLEHWHIVLTLRSEFEPQLRDLIEQTDWQEAWQKGRFIVTPMNREELQEVIEEPAAQRALFFESPKLVNQLIDEVINMPGALPLLSFTLSELYLRYLKAEENQQRDDRTITEADYIKLGGVTRSLTQTADKTYQSLIESEQVNEFIIRNVMLRMVEVSGGEIARRRVPITELEYPGDNNQQVTKIIKRFLEARLIVKGLDTEVKEYVEPAHDALVMGWSKIKDWLSERKTRVDRVSRWQSIKGWLNQKLGKFNGIGEVEFPETEQPLKVNLPLRRELTTAANNWQHKKQLDGERQAGGFLWNADPRLPQLKQVQKFEDNWFNALEKEFVERSLKRKRNNQNQLIGGVTTAFVLISMGATIAFIQQTQAKHSEINALISSSENALEVNRQLEALIASVKAGKRLQEMNAGWGLEGLVQKVIDAKRWAATDVKTTATLNQVLARIQESNRLEKHGARVNHVIFSPKCPDGKTLIASASHDNTVNLWKSDGTLMTPEPLEHDDNVISVSFSRNCQTLASASLDGTVKIWSRDEKAPKILKAQNLPVLESLPVLDVSISPNGKKVALASEDGTVQIWSVEGKLLKILKGHERFVTSVSFSPDGKTLTSASGDKKIKLWSVDGKEHHSWLAHSKPINFVSFSPDGQMLASASTDKTIKLWNLEGQLLETLEGHEEGVTSVSFSPDGQTLASASTDKTIKLWNLESQLLKTLEGHEEGVTSVSFSPDGQTLASASEDRTVKLWSVNSKNLVNIVQSLEGHSDGGVVKRVIFSPNGKTFASYASYADDDQIIIWNSNGNLPTILKGHEGSVTSISFSPDGQTLASASADGLIKLWNLEEDELPKTLKGHEGSVTSISFSPDGQTLASASADKTIKLWDLDGKLLKTLKGHEGFVSTVNFSPDGQILASASYDTTIKLWRLDGTLLKTFENCEQPIRKISFSPDGKTLVSLFADKKANIIKLWRLDGHLIATLDEHRGSVTSVGFSLNSQTLVSAGEDGLIKLWSLNGKERRSWPAHSEPINRISLSPDGQVIASASDDDTVKLWSLQGELLKTLEDAEYSLFDVSFRPVHGDIIAAASSDATVMLWNLDLEHLLERSCHWLSDYLANNPNVAEEQYICPKPLEEGHIVSYTKAN